MLRVAVEFNIEEAGGHRRVTSNAPQRHQQERVSRPTEKAQRVRKGNNEAHVDGKASGFRPQTGSWTLQTYRSLVPCLMDFVQFAKLRMLPAINRMQARERP